VLRTCRDASIEAAVHLDAMNTVAVSASTGTADAPPVLRRDRRCGFRRTNMRHRAAVALTIIDQRNAWVRLEHVEAIDLLGRLIDDDATRVLSSRALERATYDSVALVDATLESSTAVLFDAVVFPGADAVKNSLRTVTMEFPKDQYRHSKSILALGPSSMRLDKVSIPKKLPSGQPDPRIVVGASGPGGSSAKAFVAAIDKHGHPERESNPPLI